jgi:hypothetical protein
VRVYRVDHGGVGVLVEVGALVDRDARGVGVVDQQLLEALDPAVDTRLLLGERDPLAAVLDPSAAMARQLGAEKDHHRLNEGDRDRNDDNRPQETPDAYVPAP